MLRKFVSQALWLGQAGGPRAAERASISNEHKNSSKEPKNRLNEIFARLSQPLSFDP